MTERTKTPPHPAASRADFWHRGAATKAAALEAARRENIELERHHRAALEALSAAGIPPPIPR